MRRKKVDRANSKTKGTHTHFKGRAKNPTRGRVSTKEKRKVETKAKLKARVRTRRVDIFR